MRLYSTLSGARPRGDPPELVVKQRIVVRLYRRRLCNRHFLAYRTAPLVGGISAILLVLALRVSKCHSRKSGPSRWNISGERRSFGRSNLENVRADRALTLRASDAAARSLEGRRNSTQRNGEIAQADL